MEYRTLNDARSSNLNHMAHRMFDMANLLSDRIQEVIDSGFTQAELYRAAGVTKGTSNQWIVGKIKSIKLEYAQGIQTLTGFNATWLVTGKGVKKIANFQPQSKIHPDIQALIDLMNSTDDRGKKKILNAAQDTWEIHEAHLRKIGQSSAGVSDQIGRIGNISRKHNKTDPNDDLNLSSDDAI